MKNYLSLALLWIIGVLVIFFYYIGYPFHSESKDVFFFLYLFLVGILYAGYKILQNISQNTTIVIKSSYLIYGFFTQYLLVCIYFFIVSGTTPGLGMLLFFKSIFYILACGVIWLSFYCFGNKILSLHSSMKIEDPSIKILTSIGIGFIVSMFFIFLAASIGEYNILTMIIILLIVIGISYKEWVLLFSDSLNYRKVITRKSNEIGGSVALIINEMLFIIISFLISVNFLSVFRPFPIGWDDLGAYMNYPKLLSGAGEHIAFGKMYMWELYTGIGFLAGSQTFAFYLNSFAGVIAVIAIYFSVNAFTQSTKQKYNFGLLASCMFLMMPMVVFQIAKDMKIDVGLLSISVIALSLLYYLLFSAQKKNLALYGILGIIIGAAFAIKVTSLLLLLGVVGAFFYSKYHIKGFIVFLLLFVGIFSIINLWGLMNIVIPGVGNTLTQFGTISLGLGIGGFILLFISKSNKINEIGNNIFILQLASIILGFILVLIPWMVKHSLEIPKDYQSGATTLISGVAENYEVDYSQIYTTEELELIESVLESGINSSGTTSNEDWGRYFGYEKGINNFLKLPWNLTFQINQKGEFTDITFLFLALIPGLFLFLPYRKEIYKYPVIGAIGLGMLYFIPSVISGLISSLFAQINLPEGYAVIVGLFILPLVYFSWALDRKNKATNFFLINLSFLTVYMGLWALSSYGVVWYGIVMYFVLFVIIFLCILSIDEESELHNYVSYSVLVFVLIYALQSAIPHGIMNLKTAGYDDYKIGGFNEEVSLMAYHPEYFPIMFELNISDEKKQELFIDYRKKILLALSNTPDFEQILPQIQAYKSMNELHRLIVELSKVDFPQSDINAQVEEMRQELYELIIYTPKEIKNTKNIYRVGTFLKYFISENNTRLFEDGLLTTYDTYIKSDDSSIVLDRFNKLSIDYILLDLNAATIDNDPAKNLTRRYEELLNFLKTPEIELIETDSICLRIALDNYKIEKNLETYMGLASVNHNSEYSQNEKRTACFTIIHKIISNDDILTQYPYLTPYKNAIIASEIDMNDEEMVIGALGQLIRGNGFKALFRIN